jgi:lactoylglutathione lyase
MRRCAPRLPGLAHIALSAHDFAASRAYYRDFLGYEEVFTLPKADGSVGTAFIKINDRQYIELSPENEAGTDRLKHIALETDNARTDAFVSEEQGHRRA